MNRLPTILLAISLLAAACGADSQAEPAPSTTTSSAPSSSAPTTTTTVAPDVDADVPFSPPSDTTELAWSSGAGPGTREQDSITWAGSAFAAFSSGRYQRPFVVSADGREWTESSPFVDDADILGVSGWGDSMVVWGRDDVLGAPRLAISRDGGVGWEPLGTDGLLPDQTPYVTFSALIENAAVIDDTVVVEAVISSVDVDVEQAALDAGLRGVALPRGSTAEDRYVLLCATADSADCERHEYAEVGITSESLDPTTSLYRSIGGEPFERVEFAPLPPSTPYFGVVDGQFVIAGPARIYTSADGDDWTISPIADELSGIVSTNTDMFAMRGTEVVRSADLGHTWQPIAVPDGTTGLLGAGPGGLILAGEPKEAAPPDQTGPAPDPPYFYFERSIERDDYTISWATNPFGITPSAVVVTDARGNQFGSSGYVSPDAQPALVISKGECPVVYELRNPETDDVLLQITNDDIAVLVSSPEFGPDGERSEENRSLIAWSPDAVDFRWQPVDAGFTPSGAERTATRVTSVAVGETAMVAIVAEAMPPRENALDERMCGAVQLTASSIPRVHTARLS